MAARHQRPEFYPGLPVTGGMLIPTARALPPLLLKHTAVDVTIVGPICDVHLTQQFQNDHTRPLEAIYAFPLPEDAAVTELTLTIGERVIRGEVREHDEARRDYEAARDQGQGAALLEQERPNLFTVAVANIQPGEQVEVMLRFHDRVHYDDGAFEFVFPTVILPRYVPVGESASASLNPPLLPEHTRDGHTLSVKVELDVGKLVDISSPTHDIEIAGERGIAVVTLRKADAIPNKDFILRYKVASNQFEYAAFTYRGAGQPGTVLLMLTPKAELQPEDVLPRELLFVFDRSGSMSGDSIVQARNALKACLRALNPADSFNIFPFDNRVEQFSLHPLRLTQKHVDKADAYIEGIDARGGTEILNALQTALRQPRDAERLRVVVFLTDGAVGNEDQVLRELRKSLNEARIFAFGIGSAVNRFLLDKLAEVGRGSVEYIFPGQVIEDVVQRFQNRAAFPVLTDLGLDWGGARVTDLLPTPLPDLYAGQPLSILARFHNPQELRTTVRLSGRTTHGRYEQTVEVEWPTATPDRAERWAVLSQVWARVRIDALMSHERDDPKQKGRVRDEILGLALEHHLLSPYTSFVAIEERRAEHGRRAAAEPVVVPIHLPQGTRREAFEVTDALLGASMGYGGPMAGASLYRLASPASVLPSPAPDAGPMGKLLGRFRSAAPQSAEAAAAYKPKSGGATAGQAEITTTPAQRYEAALRYLARTQGVSGAWGESPVATALALLAFLKGGHSDRAGNYRPQLTRAVRWLMDQANRPQTPPAVAWALAALALHTRADAHIAASDAALAHAVAADEVDEACLKAARGFEFQDGGASSLQTLSANLTERGALELAARTQDKGLSVQLAELLAQNQQGSGHAAGAVVPPGRRADRPDAVVFAATAAGALAWGGL